MNIITPKWINKEQAIYIHDLSIEKNGGRAGLRDEGLLDSSLHRPQHFFAYGEKDIRVLAAVYAQGISQNHAFVDGNKRAAYSVSGLFLHFNGLTLEIPSVEKQVTFFRTLADGKISFDELISFYQANTKEKRTQP